MFASAMKQLLPDAIPRYYKCGSNSNLVLLLGWGASKPKNLTKIEQYYKERGIGVVAQNMPLFFAFPGFMRTVFEDMITASIHQHFVANPTAKLFVHSYSNNGAWTYTSMSTRKHFIAPSKVLLDSAPYLRMQMNNASAEAEALSRVVVSAILKKPVYNHQILSPVLKIFFCAALRAAEIIEKFQGSLNIIPNILYLNEHLKFHTPPVPTLLVYSTGDKLVPYDAIQEFRDILLKRGMQVEERMFGDEVQHTGAFFAHTDEYKKLVDKFFELK